MRHFLFEFITGGGLIEQGLPESLVREGDLMLQALIAELTELNVEITISRDSRLERLDENINQLIVNKSIDKLLPQLIKNADFCWLIAPETNQYLAHYAELFYQHKARLIGSNIDAIRLCSSKYLSNTLLRSQAINAVVTKRINQQLPHSDTGWVIKPDDGVGAEGVSLFSDKQEIDFFKEVNGNSNSIVQPYINGEHMSMSLLVHDKTVILLGCNKQYINIEQNKFKLKKIGVNEMVSYKDKMLELAKKIIAVIPGLTGYIGVDVIAHNNDLVVIEINPRLTTAYTALSASLGCNVASKILAAVGNKESPDVELASAKPIAVSIN